MQLSRFEAPHFDRRFGVETTAAVGKFNLGLAPEITSHVSSYNAVDLGVFKRALARSELDPHRSCFVDVGSGKGRTLFAADQAGFSRIIGIELSAAIHRVAERNLRTYKSKSNSRIELHNMDALAFDWPIQPTLLFMFNPFDDAIMEPFIAKLDRSLEHHPRPFEVIYVHPWADAVVAKSKYLQKIFEDRRWDEFAFYRCGAR
jgi:cyclopropane fatty-acyl-phospholipid synthase-like methyltransferase